jgi:hypothetical protein
VTVSLVQTASPNSLVSPPQFASNTTTGNTLAIAVQWADTDGAGTTALSSVGDGGTNSYTVLGPTLSKKLGHTGDFIYVQFAVASGITGAATPTLTPTFSQAPTGWFATAWELTPSTSTQTATANGTTETTQNVGPVTPVAAGSVGLATAMQDDGNAAGSYSVTAPWTRDQNTGGGAWEETAAHYANAGTAAMTASFVNTNTPTQWVASMIVFQPPATATFLPPVSVSGQLRR